MKECISELKSTIENNITDLMEDAAVVNELVVSDLMIYLGYNRRKDKNVKRVFNKGVDWEIMGDSYKLGVITTKLEEDSIETLEEDFSYKSGQISKDYNILMITNGRYIRLYIYDEENQSYVEIAYIDICEYNDSNDEILDAISKERFDIDVLNKILASQSISAEDIREMLVNHREEIISFISSLEDIKESKIAEAYDKFISDFNSNGSEQSEEENVRVINVNLSKEESEKSEKAVTDLENANKRILELEEKVAALEKENEEIGSEQDKFSSEVVEENREEIEELKKKVEMLQAEKNELSNASEEAERYKKMLEQNNQQIDDYMKKLEGKDKEIERLKRVSDEYTATQLISIVEESNNNSGNPERGYAAVIGTELIQLNVLSTFIGRCLQMLAEIKHLDALNHIFDGHNFKLKSTSERKDIMINDMMYDIDLDGVSEEDALKTLESIFSKFEDVVFKYKVLIPRVEVRFNNQEQGFINDNMQTEMNMQPQTVSNQENQMFSQPVGNGFNGNEQLEGFDVSDEVEEQPQKERVLLVSQLGEADKLIYTDEDVNFVNVKYLGTQEVTFAICNKESDEPVNCNMVFCKCVNALFATETYIGNNTDAQFILGIKQFDFSRVSNYIKLYSDEYRGCPKIDGTKFVVSGMDSMQQVVATLIDVCNALGIDVNSKFIYLDTETNSSLIIDNYGYAEESVQLLETSFYEANENDPTHITAIRGDLFNHIIVSRGSLRAHKDVIKNVLRVKTKYIESTIENPESVVAIIKAMFEKAIELGKNINCNALGNVLGEKYRIVSMNESEVCQDHISFMVNGQVYYCSVVETWCIPHTLIKLHNSLINDTAIGIQIEINVSAVNFYGGEFETPEPALSLAVKSFADYISSCVKV